MPSLRDWKQLNDLTHRTKLLLVLSADSGQRFNSKKFSDILHFNRRSRLATAHEHLARPNPKGVIGPSKNTGQ